MIPIIKYSALNISFYIFISLNPYFRWLIPNEIFYFLFLFTTLVLTTQLYFKVKNGIVIDKWKTRVFYAIGVFVLYFTTSLVHDMRWGHFLWFLPFMSIVFYNSYIIQKGYQYFKKIMFWFTLFALLYWILNTLNISVPYFSYHPDFRYSDNDYYRIYGPAISLYSGSYPVGGVYGIERITGIFAEPGHYGLYLGCILAIDRFNFVSKENQIFILTGILTFSTAFYGILFLGLIYRLFVDKKLSKGIQRILLLLSFSFIVGFLFGGDAFKELTYGRVLKDDNSDVFDMVESRTSDRFVDTFNEFSTTSDVILGFGYFGHESSIQTTNWRGLVYRFGIVGLIVLVFLTVTIVGKAEIYYSILLFAIIVLILSHRSYLLYVPWAYILIFIATALSIDNLEPNLA